jgi:hypothetical protein
MCGSLTIQRLDRKKIINREQSYGVGLGVGLTGELPDLPNRIQMPSDQRLHAHIPLLEFTGLVWHPTVKFRREEHENTLTRKGVGVFRVSVSAVFQQILKPINRLLSVMKAVEGLLSTHLPRLAEHGAKKALLCS